MIKVLLYSTLMAYHRILYFYVMLNQCSCFCTNDQKMNPVKRYTKQVTDERFEIMSIEKCNKESKSNQC